MPTISIVTPSFNQGSFLEATIRSVLDGSDRPDEYVIADGGSTDGSAKIIERYADRLTAWWSEPDRGQYAAISRAFSHTSCDVMGWLNSDDLYMPWTLSVVRSIFERFPDVEWLTTLYPLTVDAAGCVVASVYTGGFDRGAFRTGELLPFTPGYWRGVQQESTFWRRSLWERAGARFDESLDYAGDFELWCRFAEQADLVGVEAPLAAFRSHGDQKSATGQAKYLEEGMRILHADGRRPTGPTLGRLRAGISVFVGRRSLKRLPSPIARALVWSGLLRPARVLSWRDGQWHLYADYVA